MKRLVIFGASGKVGRLLVDQALERGHKVTVVVRDSSRFSTKHENLKLVVGQVTNPKSVAAIIKGHDAVLSAVGVKSFINIDIFSKSASSILCGMKQHGIKRFICITSGVIEDDDPAFDIMMRLLIRPIIMRSMIRDMRRLEVILKNADWAEWTTVRPGGNLIDGPLTGNYKVSPRFVPTDRSSLDIPRADVAHFMLNILESDEWIHGTPTICS